MLADGARIDERGGPLESTPLHEAAHSAEYTGRKGINTGRNAVVRLLLQLGADVSAKDTNGDTPLQYAERQGHEEVARLLRDAEVTPPAAPLLNPPGPYCKSRCRSEAPSGSDSQ